MRKIKGFSSIIGCLLVFSDSKRLGPLADETEKLYVLCALLGFFQQTGLDFAAQNIGSLLYGGGVACRGGILWRDKVKHMGCLDSPGNDCLRRVDADVHHRQLSGAR